MTRRTNSVFPAQAKLIKNSLIVLYTSNTDYTSLSWPTMSLSFALPIPCKQTWRVFLHASSHAERLLVAGNVHIPIEIHLRMCWWPNRQSKHSPHSPWIVSPHSGISPPILFHTSWSHHWTTHFPQFQLYHGHGRPSAYKGGNLLPLHQGHWCSQSCPTLFLPHFSSIWPTLQGDLRQRTSICLHICLRTCPSPPIWCIPFNCLSPTDWWRDGTSKSGTGNLSKTIHLKWAWRMVNLAPYDRIHSQLCHSFCHTMDPILLDDGIQT